MGEGGKSPLPFIENRKKNALILEKRALFLKKCAMFVCIDGLNSHLKRNFKSIFEKKHLMRVVHETFIEVPLFLETSPA